MQVCFSFFPHVYMEIYVCLSKVVQGINVFYNELKCPVMLI